MAALDQFTRMKKFIALIAPEREFTPANYPQLFRFFESIPRGAHFRPGILAFEHGGDAAAAHDAIRRHLGDGDDLIVFELCGGRWSLDRMRGGARKHERLQKFLEGDTK